MKSKAQSLPLNTIVVLVIILVAVVLILIFVSKYGSQIWGGIGQQVNSTVSISQDVPKLQP
ncbi:MAG TPA: hypothetical protein VJG30_04425 [Candidatus Nanoarchaeia archaeon]|nr:hypothetical protein [Candidatus Nanoarchaeia archaeon]